MAALTGVWLETGTVMPTRHPLLLMGPDGPPQLLVHEIEVELARRRCPGELAEIIPIVDPVSHREEIQRWLAASGTSANVGMDYAGLGSSQQLLPADIEYVDVSHRLPDLLRGFSATELTTVHAAASVLGQAVSTVLSWSQPPAPTERDLAARLAAEVIQRSGDWYDLVPIVSSGPRLRIPHARPSGEPPQDGDLCRLGVRARYGPYHVMCVRSAVARGGGYLTTEGICGAAAADAATLTGALRPGAAYRDLVQALPPRETPGGPTRAGHGLRVQGAASALSRQRRCPG